MINNVNRGYAIDLPMFVKGSGLRHKDVSLSPVLSKSYRAHSSKDAQEKLLLQERRKKQTLDAANVRI